MSFLPRGFTLIETLTVMGILAILGGISIPTYTNWREKELFSQRADRAFSLMDQARSNAATEKKCSGGQDAKRWIFQVDLASDPKIMRLLCEHDTGTITEAPTTPDDTDYILNDQYISPSFFREYDDGTIVSDSPNSTFQIEFLVDPAGIVINTDLTDSDYDVKMARLNFTYAKDSNEQKTLCLHQVGGYVFFSLENDACVEGPTIVEDDSGDGDESCSPSNPVGTTPCQGGVYAGNGLIAKADNESSMRWGNDSDEAIGFCDALDHDGYDDWYLPDINQLEDLYDQESTIGGFPSGKHWSSTEYSGSRAETVNFSNGSVSDDNKNGNHNVRCVRNFS